MQKSTHSVDYQDLPRPVAVMVSDFSDSTLLDADPPHSHPRAQLLFAVEGVYTIETATGTWLVPPHRAAWIPAGVTHNCNGRGQAILACSLYIDPAVSNQLPNECCIIEVSTLLRSLISEAIDIPSLYEPEGRDGRVMSLIVDEICRAPTVPLHLPMPRDPRLLRICRMLLAEPGNDGDLDDWARVGNVGRRTLTRLFRSETGITFSHWRQQLRLMVALSRLAAGDAVTTIALDLGYESPSAFTSMFRTAMGRTPKEYLGGLAQTPVARQGAD
ncbi:AraC family transcriptional regulator [Pandoraea norimbergensis]|nr:helix-turn-helix transcriptional regulator [Pandoraea norimbergensis]ALS60003.2 hypothetical protein AT302_09745 [Pandoraea norimbergensis]